LIFHHLEEKVDNKKRNVRKIITGSKKMSCYWTDSGKIRPQTNFCEYSKVKSEWYTSARGKFRADLSHKICSWIGSVNEFSCKDISPLCFVFCKYFSPPPLLFLVLGDILWFCDDHLLDGRTLADLYYSELFKHTYSQIYKSVYHT